MEISERVKSISDTVVQAKVVKAMHLIERAIALYGLEGLAFSFNGGKDSTVLLHLMRAVLAAQGLPLDTPGKGLGGIHSFYFTRQDDFQELEEFVAAADKEHNLNVQYLENPDFKEGLVEYLQASGVKGILLGTRRGDPNAGDQEGFCPSSAGWPPFMRVNPILDWTYSDVWAFLRAVGAKYCCLYDQGYTSLGSRHNTFPNNALRKEDGSYAPAYLLLDGRLERAGRSKGTVQRQPSFEAPPGAACCRAGVVVVGDEILSGKVTDVNAGFLCRELRAIGWLVCKVVVVADDVAAIAAEVAALSGCMQAVLTSGGVGPTLDDVTMEGVAQALGQPLIRNPSLEERLRAYFGANVTESHLKMAETPSGPDTQLIDYPMEDGSPSPFPLVRCRNIFVLPGVPHLLRRKWAVVSGLLQEAVHMPPFHNRVLRLDEDDEARIAPALQALADETLPGLAIGSYPVVEQVDGAKVLVTLEGRQLEGVEAAASRLLELLPDGCQVVGEHRNVTLLPLVSPSGNGTAASAAGQGQAEAL